MSNAANTAPDAHTVLFDDLSEALHHLDSSGVMDWEWPCGTDTDTLRDELGEYLFCHSDGTSTFHGLLAGWLIARGWSPDDYGLSGDTILSTPDYGLSVEDPAGGTWWPDDAAREEIADAPDSGAAAIRICESAPIRGTWCQ